MPTNTTNFNLIKPTQEEFYNVDVPNSNMDTIDGLLKALQDAINSGASAEDLSLLSGALTTHLADEANPHKVTKFQVGLGNVGNYAIATQEEAKAGLVDNKYMNPLRTKEAIAELAPKPITLSAGPTLISDNISVPGASLAVGTTSGDIVRWNATVGGVVRVFWKMTTNSSSATDYVFTWVEVNGVRQGDEKTISTSQIASTQFTQEVTINPGDRIAIRYRHTATTARTLGLSEAYIGAIMNKFAREV